MFEQIVQASSGGVILRLRVIPNAAHTATAGVRGDRVVVRVKAPPGAGQANLEVLRWAAEFFSLRNSSVSLLRGRRGHEKDIFLTSATVESSVQGLTVK